MVNSGQLSRSLKSRWLKNSACSDHMVGKPSEAASSRVWQVRFRVCLCCQLTCRPSFFVASSLRACEVLSSQFLCLVFFPFHIFSTIAVSGFEPVQYGFLRRETMSKVRCAHCGCRFIPNPRIKNQRYCGSIQCQRARNTGFHRNDQLSSDTYFCGAVLRIDGTRVYTIFQPILCYT